MAKRKSAHRHYTIFESVGSNTRSSRPSQDAASTSTSAASTSTPIASSDSARQDGTTLGSKRRRVVGGGSPSQAVRDSSPLSHLGSDPFSANLHQKARSSIESLAHLPADLLLRIADFVQPERSPFRAGADDGPSSSSTWIDPGRDLMAFRATCKAIYFAVKPLDHTSLGLTFRPDRSPTDSVHRVIRALAPIPRPSFTISLEPELDSSRIRHFWIHSNYRLSNGGLTSAQELGRAIRTLSRLMSFAFVHTEEDSVVSSSPYNVTVIGHEVLLALASLPALKEIYLCGVKLWTTSGEPMPTFPSVQALTMNACHDTTLGLINACPNLRVVKAWRDFARVPRSEPTGWWKSEVWRSVEDVELRGFSGSNGRSYCDAWISSLRILRDTVPLSMPPLRSLRLCEAYPYQQLVTSILPAFDRLPHLESFTCMVWRDRQFGPEVLRLVAEHLPNLRVLGVTLENDGLNWWPGHMTEYGAQLALLPRLHTFIWNYTTYAELDFADSRSSNFAPTCALASRAGPNLNCIRWLNEDLSLVKGVLTGEWKWSDESEDARLVETTSSSGRSRFVEDEEAGIKSHAMVGSRSRMRLMNRFAATIKPQSRSLGVMVDRDEEAEGAGDDSGFFEGADDRGVE